MENKKNTKIDAARRRKTATVRSGTSTLSPSCRINFTNRLETVILTRMIQQMCLLIAQNIKHVPETATQRCS